MTKTLNSQEGAAGSRPPLVTRPLLLRFVSIIGASTSFYLLLSVVPSTPRNPAAATATPPGSPRAR
ncbi:hypothetical protein O1L60_03610 [Streptomyces diastatochromogenes]|nr:hypothetical protein [Streptomyces diastatochromogenes]